MLKSLFLILLLSVSTFLVAQTPELVVPVRTSRPYVMKTVQNNKYMIISNSSTFQVWENTGGRLLKSFNKSTSNVIESPDKKKVAITSKGYIHFFDFEKFDFEDSIKVLNVALIEYAPNKNAIYAISKTEKIRSLLSVDIATKQIDTIFASDNGKGGVFANFKLSNDGQYSIFQADKGSTFIINNTTKQAVKTFEQQGSFFIFSPDNKLVEVAKIKDNDYVFKVLNINTFAEEVSIKATTKAIPYNTEKFFWLDKTRLLSCNSEISAVVDFKAKTVTGDFKYYSNYQPADFIAIGKTENGTVKTFYRLITYPENRLEEWDITNYTKLRTIGNAALAPFSIALAPNDFRFQYGANREIRLGRNLNFWQVDAKNDRSSYSPDGKFRLHSSNYLILEKFKSMDKTGKMDSYISSIQGIKRSASGIHFNKKGNIAALVNSAGMYIIDAENMTMLHEVTVGDENLIITSDELGCFIDNDTKIIAYGHFQDKTEKTYCVDVATGKILWSVNGFNVSFMPTTEGVMCFDTKNNKILWLNPQTGATLKTQDTGHNFKWDSAIKVSFSPDGKQLMFAESAKVYFYDIKNKKLTPASLNLATTWMWSVKYFQHKPQLALSMSDDGKLILWNTQEARPLATFYIFNDTNEWVCMTPDGRFDASQGAFRKLYYTKGKEIIPLEQLYEKYYTPGLVAQLIGGDTPLPIDEDDDIKKLKSPPSVKIKFENKQRNLTVEDDVPTYTATQAQVSLTIEAVSKDDVIDEIRLFQNGKLVGGTTRNLVVEDDKKASESKVFTVSLLEGENRFKAIALNSQRTESAPDEIIITYKPAKTVTQTTNPTNDINLHMVVVGINKYKNPKYNLNYATADATSFKEAIEKGGNGIFNKTNIIFIGDDKATKEGISTELDKIKTASNPKDVFIFYYAGHGVLNEKKDFFLVPHDVIQLYGADDALAQKGLSANVLQQYSKDIKAQKQLFILDACQSAGALDKLVAARGAAEEKAIAQLARATGTHWLTASGSEQFASEFTQLGHGTFTYVLLEALSGKADKGGDKKVTVKEIDAYLQEVVPEVTAKYKGTPQYPASFGFGNDFPIGVVRQ